MISKNELFQQLDLVLDKTDLPFLGQKYSGKVRDNYSAGEVRYQITTDRLSCFDVIVTTVPFKGQVLNQIAAFWFGHTSDIVKNHMLDVPDPNVMVVRSCEVLPFEVVVRGYLAGSAWRDYAAERPVSGIRLPPGLSNYQKLPEPLITPSTKAAKGSHDTPISEEEIVSSGLVDKKLWSEVHETALALFARGQEEAGKNGLILADTKYEFGLSAGKLRLVDEVHTLDSSRYWIASSYQTLLSEGKTPEMLDKEPTRQWLLSKGFSGNGPVPEFDRDHRVAIAEHYIRAFELLTGTIFQGIAGSVHERLLKVLKAYVGKQ